VIRSTYIFIGNEAANRNSSNHQHKEKLTRTLWGHSFTDSNSPSVFTIYFNKRGMLV